jgi:ribosomal protein S18 acetylase RimI-like enzyme
VKVEWATPRDVETVSSILREAATWLRERGMPLWRDEDLLPAQLRRDVAQGLYCLARSGDAASGTARIQMQDPEIWPEATPGQAAYVHRIAVRRGAAGSGVPRAIFDFAREIARQRGCSHLRLDCDASRAKLRDMYRSLGFRLVDQRRVASFVVARFEQRIDG